MQKFYQVSEKRFKLRKLDFDRDELKKVIDGLYKQALNKYSSLSMPKLCSQDVYVSNWINEGVGEMIAKKGMGKSYNLNNPPDELKASTDFYLNFPFGSIKESVDFDLLKRKWLAMVVERNEFAIKRGYKSRLDMYLNNYVISEKEFKNFMENVDRVIDYCNSIFLEKDLVEIWELKKIVNIFGNKYPIFKKNEKRIKIELGIKSETKYIKEQDFFKITLNKNVDEKHQIMDIIHELAHVVSMLEDFKRKNFIWEGVYTNEKKAIDIEIDFLKKQLPKLYKADLEYILQVVHKTMFEIEIYYDPSRDPDKLYEQVRKRCFNKSEITRPLWVEDDIVYKNFELLPYAVAYVNSLKESEF